MKKKGYWNNISSKCCKLLWPIAAAVLGGERERERAGKRELFGGIIYAFHQFKEA